MKLPKKFLNEHNIFNSWGIADNNNDHKIFIEYIPADNGRLTSRYASWRLIRIQNTKDTIYSYKEFTVTCRENKPIELQKAIAWVKEKYGLDCTEKDPFGGYQVVGTLENIIKTISTKEG